MGDQETFDVPVKYVTETWEKSDLRFAISRVDRPARVVAILRSTYSAQHNGYCAFPKRPVIEEGYNGILTYVPIHGGITLARETEDGWMWYGFDCGHADDDHNAQLQNLGWLRAECERMAVGIALAAGYEEAYLMATTNESKAEVIQEYHDQCEKEGMHFILTDNFGAMLNVICRKL